MGENSKKKTVFITSLSMLGRPNTGYYYDPKGNRRYLAGAFTNEPGAKLFLSKHVADKLVVIGSDKTYDADRDNSPVTLGQIDINSTPAKNEKALDYFKRSIARFARGEDTLPEQNVLPERQKALLAIVKNLMKKDYPEPSEWFDVLANNENLVKELRRRLTQSVESGYVSEETIRAFDESIKLPPLPDFSRLETGDTSVSDMVKELRAMQDEAFQTLMQKEHFLLLGVTTIETRILRLEKEQLASRSEALTAAAESLETRVEAQQAVIEKLRSFVFALQKELADIRSNREQEEYAWVRKALFEKLADNRKLKALDGQLPAEIEFVPLMRGDVYNIRGIIQAIYSSAKNGEQIQLYLDVQGGDRTDAFVRSQILSLVTNDVESKVKINQIISTDFHPQNFANAMRDETARYQISSLVSGMNAFTEYGKTGILEEYFLEGRDANEAQMALLTAMREIDQAITMSNVNALEKGIQHLRQSLNGPIIDDTETGELFAVLIDGIRRDYGRLLDGDHVDTFDLIDWTRRKGLIMQCLAIIEAKTPDTLVDKHILFYPPNQEEPLKQMILNDAGAANFLSANTYFIRNYFKKPQFTKQYGKEEETPPTGNTAGNSNKPKNKKRPLTPGENVTQELLFGKVGLAQGMIRVRSDLERKNYTLIGELVNCYLKLVTMRNNVFHGGNKIPIQTAAEESINEFTAIMRQLLAQPKRAGIDKMPQPKPQPKQEPQPQA